MKYEFEITPPWGQLEDFNANDDNVASFKVFDSQNKEIGGQDTYVTLFCSFNAMLGLGTELIRLAHNFEEGKEIHVTPSSREKGAQEAMGIYLTPVSCELVIKCMSYPPIEECLKQWANKQK